MPKGTAPKRLRPPNINLSFANEKRGPPIQVENTGSSYDLSVADDEFEDTLQLSSPDSSGSMSPTIPALPVLSIDSSDEDGVSDDISKDLAALEELRKNVKKNLRLRPIRSRSNLPRVDLHADGPSMSKSPLFLEDPTVFTPPPLSARYHEDAQTVISPTSSTSSYFTPISETPSSARFTGSTNLEHAPAPQRSSPGKTYPVSPQVLYDRLLSPKRPLLIDARPPTIYSSFHVQYSINIAIPSLILKRCRKPGGGFQTLDALRQFVTSDQGKKEWDDLMQPGGPWDGDVIVYDDEMDVKDKDRVGATAWALIPVLSPLLSYGGIAYLEGGISAAGHNPDFETLIVLGDENGLKINDEGPPPLGTPGAKKGGLFQLNTQGASRSKNLIEIEPASSTSSNPPTPPSRSPLPVMPGSMSSSRMLSTPEVNSAILDPSPSPPPSSIGFRRPPPPRRPSVPNLRRLETSSCEKLGPNIPKLSVRTKPMRSATLTVPPTLFLPAPTSPSHLKLFHSNHSPPATSTKYSISSPSVSDPSNYLTPYYTPPHTPGTPKFFSQLQPPPTPLTARPEFDQPPSTEEPYPVFTISTILPNFLYLGPELTLPEHVEELQELGVRRILNIAAECDDDQGLRLREVFEKYVRIPMRDTVEEDNIARGVQEVCEILDDARLHSAPTYVHCKAGKSRSVTAVMAYLIHANHWTLSRAYSFVLERRKGISPNIGFVSELMTFEEHELGGKSIGVQPGGGGAADGSGTNGDATLVGSGNYRRGGHVRESLPPALGGLEGMTGIAGPISAGGLIERVMGDSGQEMEIKDSSGRYRHARRAPVDETTLQPMRRVSKAGLESSAYA